MVANQREPSAEAQRFRSENESEEGYLARRTLATTVTSRNTTYHASRVNTSRPLKLSRLTDRASGAQGQWDECDYYEHAHLDFGTEGCSSLSASGTSTGVQSKNRKHDATTVNNWSPFKKKTYVTLPTVQHHLIISYHLPSWCGEQQHNRFNFRRNSDILFT
jgi:hypothetical protein